MSSARSSKELPPWVMPLAVILGVLLIVFVAVRALNGTSGNPAGPAREVHPGMYDFRKEAQQGNIGRRTAVPDGTTPAGEAH